MELLKRSLAHGVLLAGILASLLGVLSPARAAADSPWWQVLSGSRPTNMWEPSDNEQELKTTLGEKAGQTGSAAAIAIHGKVIGCLGTANAIGSSICKGKTGFATPIQTAAELQSLLGGAFGDVTGAVEVSGGPVPTAPLHIVVHHRGAPQIRLTPLLGTASSEVLADGGSGRLFLTVTNLGDASVDATGAPVAVTDRLPAGMVADEAQGFGGVLGSAGSVDCAVEAPDEVSCEFEGVLPSYEAIEIEIFATLTGEPPSEGAPGEVSVSGGGAPPASAPQTVRVSDEPVSFGIERFFSQTEEEGGAVASQAGAHPFQLTTTIQLSSGFMSPAADRDRSTVEQPALPRNLDIRMPPGLVANVRALKQCDMATFQTIVELHNACPDDTAIGVSAVTFVEASFYRLAVPIFNLPPAYGEPARMGFVAAGVPVVIDTEFESDNRYAIVAKVRNVTQIAQFLASTLSLWGTPGDPRHDDARGWNCVSRLLNPELPPCERPPSLSEDAFLRQGVSCAAPLLFGATVEPWNVPLGSRLDDAAFTGGPLHACNRVPFDPAIAATPTAKLAESPGGLDFKLTMPNSGLLNGGAIAEGQPKKIEIALPEGITLNASSAEGLAVCSPADYARERFNSRPGEGCPEASKIGNVQIDTPLVKEERLSGALYLATPRDNPSGSLVALYIVARLPERGVLLKLAGEVIPDKQTGQIVTIFDDAPPLPFSSFKLHFREGGRAPLVTPPACGDYQTLARFTPWSAQDPNHPRPGEVVPRTSTFTVQKGVDGGACPPGGVPPFEPEFQAGSLNNNAASFSEFDMRLIRHDGEQDMTKFSAVLPPGVLGSLAGVGKCSDAGVAAAKAKTGKEEQASPSCPADSEIGHTFAGAGVGSVLTYIPGRLYLGGPYHGDPLSVISITPAVAGPFDVGTVVVQVALTLNPRTAEVEVDGSASDPIPHILEGIPVKVRDLRVYVDRNRFILNPTSCEESQAKSTLFGSYLDVLSPADDRPVDLKTRYQAANCANLGFKPKLALKLQGGTRRGAHPGLKAIYRPRAGDANLKGLTVRLPSSAFLDQAHIRTICTRVQFAANGGNGGGCPQGAIYGHATAYTPLLDQPLEGPVYLRSSSHNLPDFVAALHGTIDVEAVARIDSKNGGIRASFETVPDAPLTKVVVDMQGGKKGLIINSKNLCYKPGKDKADAKFTGHNGKQAGSKPVVRAAKCKKGGKRGASGHGR